PLVELGDALDQLQHPLEVVRRGLLQVRGVNQRPLAEQEQASELARLEHRPLAVLPADDQADRFRGPLAVRPFAEGMPQHEPLPVVQLEPREPGKLDRLVAGRVDVLRNAKNARSLRSAWRASRRAGRCHPSPPPAERVRAAREARPAKPGSRTPSRPARSRSHPSHERPPARPAPARTRACPSAAPLSHAQRPPPPTRLTTSSRARPSDAAAELGAQWWRGCSTHAPAPCNATGPGRHGRDPSRNSACRNAGTAGHPARSTQRNARRTPRRERPSQPSAYATADAPSRSRAPTFFRVGGGNL